MDSQTQQFFRNIKELDPSNNRCIDCDAAHPQWASVSHGCFICLTCSGIHRSLGVHISFVRSTTMDTWNSRQLRLMELGGNSRLSTLFKQYGLSDLSIKQKYCSKIATYYRNKLKNLLDGKSPPEIPSISIGQLEDITETNKKDELRNNDGQINNNNNDDNNNNKMKFANLLDKNIGNGNNSILGNISSFSMKLFSNTKNYAESTINHVQEHGILESAIYSVRAGTTYIEEAGKVVIEKVQDDKFWKNTSNTVQNSATWLNNTIQSGLSGVGSVISSVIEPNSTADFTTSQYNNINNNNYNISSNNNMNNMSPYSYKNSKNNQINLNNINKIEESLSSKYDNRKDSSIPNINLWENDLGDDWDPKHFQKGASR